MIKPLNELLEKNRKWVWSDACQKAFENVKQLIPSEPVLTHYDPKAPVRLACDASPYGLGAVFSHVMSDDSEKPIAFASRSLTKAESNYAQIDREACAIFWAVKKFHAYLFGRKFTLLTDHQPLASIFSPSKSTPVTSAARLQRYALFLSGFNYDIEYKSTKRHTNADGLSRLPAPSSFKDDDDETDAEDIFHLTQIEKLPVTHAVIQRETKHDKTSQVYEQVQNGWQFQPKGSPLAPFYNRRSEITIYQGCLLWGIRVIIPSKLQDKVLNLGNIYIRFGSKLYRQIVGIPMGTNCAPVVADLFLFCYERDFMLSLSEDNQSDVIEAFNSTSRYLDDLLNIDNNFFDSMVNRIYPSELQLNKANVSDAEASFLDLHLSISDGFVKTKIYDKRDDFDFDIVNFPFLDGDVPRSASYGVYISQLIRFARVSSHVDDFNTRNKVLTAKLLRQGYRYHKLRKAFSEFYRRHFDIVSKYNVGLKTLLLQGLSEPEFYGDLVYKFRKIIGKNDFLIISKR